MRAFHQQHRRVIYKSISVRAPSCTLWRRGFRAARPHSRCPTQFQALWRAPTCGWHTIGTRVFATAIHTQAIDYRYVQRQGGEASLHAIALPDELAERCLRLAQALGLAFAGIDLKLTPDKRLLLLRLNLSPASAYGGHTGQPAHAWRATHGVRLLHCLDYRVWPSCVLWVSLLLVVDKQLTLWCLDFLLPAERVSIGSSRRPRHAHISCTVTTLSPPWCTAPRMYNGTSSLWTSARITCNAFVYASTVRVTPALRRAVLPGRGRRGLKQFQNM